MNNNKDVSIDKELEELNLLYQSFADAVKRLDEKIPDFRYDKDK